MAQHISVEKGSDKLLPRHHTHRLSLSNRTQGPLVALQKLANESSAVQRVNALQDMVNAHCAPVQREVEEERELRQDKTVQNTAPVQRRESSHPPNGLPQDLKSGIENLSGISMADVTVQRNSAEPAKVGAHAFAQGTNIHLGPGQDKHLPHEAWHVVQQKQGRVRPTLQMKGVAINDDAGLEREADVMGAKAMQLTSVQATLSHNLVTNTPVQFTKVVQMVTGVWHKYLLTLANYSPDAAARWEDRLQKAEDAGVPPPRQTEHASGSGSGDAGNKAGQMTDALNLWWEQNAARITESGGGSTSSGASTSRAGKGKRHNSEQEARAADEKDRKKKEAAARKKTEWEAKQRR